MSARLTIFCSCGSKGGDVDQLAADGKRRVCGYCRDRVWPPEDGVLAAAAVLAERYGRRRKRKVRS